MTGIERYQTEIGTSNSPNDRLMFTFVSKGKMDIDKVIVFDKIDQTISIPGVGVKTAYNLGFGDYDKTTQDVDDKTNSNNGDMRIIFNTVINTIPLFFHQNPDSALFVSGSEEKRTKVYCHYVSKNFETYSQQFSF